ncbi:MAG: acyl--CoA ligase [Candidatus Xenobiia bacterium LiM19]
MISHEEFSLLKDFFSPSRMDTAAIVIPDGGPSLTYAGLLEKVHRWSDELWKNGVGKGDVVSIAVPNSAEFLISFLAVTGIGAIAAPLNQAYTVEEFRFYMEDAQARAVITRRGTHNPAADAAGFLSLPVWETGTGGSEKLFLECINTPCSNSGEPPVPAAEDTALFLHTSGTTGRPKGVPLTHRNLACSISTIVKTYALCPDDVSMLAMPLFHVHGLLGVALSTLRSGGTLVIPPKFSARTFWEHAAAYRANWFSAVPTIHHILLERADEDNPPQGMMRFIRSCSSALAPATMHRMEERFGSPVLEAYGMTEASHQMASNPLPPHPRCAGTVGAATGIEIAIADGEGHFLKTGEKGEVCIQGNSVMKGYLNNPEANAAAFVQGWLRTGDQGFLDDRGYLTLTGRLKELINRGGEKISPSEVDAVLLEHPSVAEAACFGVADLKYGEDIHAAVVLKKPIPEEELINFCRERLASFKVPRKIHIMDTIPRAATGKIQRKSLSQLFAT